MNALDREFLERHRDADAIIVDEETGLVVRAEYNAPTWSWRQDNLRFFRSVTQVEEMRQEEERAEEMDVR